MKASVGGFYAIEGSNGVECVAGSKWRCPQKFRLSQANLRNGMSIQSPIEQQQWQHEDVSKPVTCGMYATWVVRVRARTVGDKGTAVPIKANKEINRPVQ